MVGYQLDDEANLYMKNCCFTKPPFQSGCLGFLGVDYIPTVKPTGFCWQFSQGKTRKGVEFSTSQRSFQHTPISHTPVQSPVRKNYHGNLRVKPMVNSPFIRPCFLGGVPLGSQANYERNPSLVSLLVKVASGSVPSSVWNKQPLNKAHLGMPKNPLEAVGLSHFCAKKNFQLGEKAPSPKEIKRMIPKCSCDMSVFRHWFLIGCTEPLSIAEKKHDMSDMWC